MQCCSVSPSFRLSCGPVAPGLISFGVSARLDVAIFLAGCIRIVGDGRFILPGSEKLWVFSLSDSFLLHQNGFRVRWFFAFFCPVGLSPVGSWVVQPWLAFLSSGTSIS